jgi:chromodomain-helicase-DNA-binding protein 7
VLLVLQVLIFSQFKMMLDVIEDYLTACDYPFERIDGDTKQSARQAAIDRFMAVKDRQRSKTPTSRAASPSPAAESGEQGSGGAAAAGSSVQKQSAANSRGLSPSAAVSGEDDTDGPFVFLLSTRAGGQGITLTSADTVIIYDSDWNPQNDLQAMARCHRIGQEKEVTVYRLVSRNTYEQQLFECSSRKMGLDEAILGFAGSGADARQLAWGSLAHRARS